MIETIDDYLDISGRAMSAVCITFDNARSAEKMADWSCIGKDNEAWKTGPYLTSPANKKDIDRSFPYCFRTSLESAVAAGIIMGKNPPKGKNGGVEIPLPPKGKDGSRVEPVISKLSIIEQFEIFKCFLSTFDGPINARKSKAWSGHVKEEALAIVHCLTNRRNELTHDVDYKLSTMKEAVEYFYDLRQLAVIFYERSLVIDFSKRNV